MRELKCQEMHLVSGGADEANDDEGILDTVIDVVSDVFQEIKIEVVGLPQHIADLVDFIKETVNPHK